MWLVCIDILKIVNWKCTVSVIIHNNSSLSNGSRYCKPEVISWWKVNITVFYTRFLSNVKKKNVFQKLAGLWLVGEVINHVGLYGSKVAEGCSAFQRRSCSIILLYGVGGSSCFINYGTMKMRMVQLKMRMVLWKWEHYNAILYNTFLKGTQQWVIMRHIAEYQWEKLKYWFQLLLNHIYFMNSLWPTDAIWRHRCGSTLAQVMDWCLHDGTKPLPEPMLTSH